MKLGVWRALLRPGVSYWKIESACVKLFDDESWSRAVMDAKILAGGFTEKPANVPHSPYCMTSNVEGRLFSPRFFAKLALFPAVELKVTESRSSLRRTCYGFREKVTRERIYLRVEKGSLLVFRDSPAGFLTGKRYFINGLKYTKNTSWENIVRVLKRGVSRMGIRLDKYDVAEHYAQDRARHKLALMLSWRRKKFLEARRDKKAHSNIQAVSRERCEPSPAATD